jgi:glucose/arabinose dehydrogenase
LQNIELPEGFSIELYAEAAGARSMALGEDALFVGSRDAGKVYAVVDEDEDGSADEVLIVARGLNSPNGVAFRDGDLYVAEIGRVIRFDDIESRLRDSPDFEVVTDAYPDDEHHGWKFIRFGPDGDLYVPVGAPCNVCDPEAPFASITRMDPETGEFDVFARGIRNTVGFDWHPDTGELWFTDNGRDWLGEDRPPDELNRAPEPGLDFGFPHCHGTSLADPEFGEVGICEESVAPEQELGPHVAALGMRFYTGDMFPERYRDQIFIAEHGSWNRTIPIGYRVTLITLEDGKPTDYQVFAEGWLTGLTSWGRPVDVQVMPDGALLVSDDEAGAIYRITYE